MLQALEKRYMTVIEEMCQKQFFKIVYISTKLLSLSKRFRLLSTRSLIRPMFFFKANMYSFFSSFNAKTSMVVFKLFATNLYTIKAIQMDCRFDFDISLITQVQFCYCSFLMVQDFKSGLSSALRRMIKDLSQVFRLSDIIRDKCDSDILLQKVKKAKKLDITLSFYCLNTVSLRDKESNRKNAKKLRGRLLLQSFLTFLLFQWFSSPL